jgi:hypothetical protein
MRRANPLLPNIASFFRLLAQLSEGKKPQKMIKQPTSFGQERDGLKAAICPFQSRFSESLWHFL